MALHMTMLRCLAAGLLVNALFGSIACESDVGRARPEVVQRSSGTGGYPQSPSASPMTTDTIWQGATEVLNEAAVKAEELRAAIDQLLSSPDADTLREAQQSWTLAMAAYERFYLYTRLGLVKPNPFERLLQHHYAIAAWPIQPGYLDGFGSHPYSGLVFDIDTPITKTSLRQQHRMTDTADVCLGLYATEFLLFGEQRLRGFMAFHPITQLSEQDKADGFTQVAELPRNRRRQLLQTQAEVLLDDVAKVRAEWSAKGPKSLQEYFRLIPADRRQALLLGAAVIMTTEQILQVVHARKPETHMEAKALLLQDQQLAERLVAQLAGLTVLLQTLDASLMKDASAKPELLALTQRTQTALQEVVDLPPIGPTGAVTITQWKASYSALAKLARALQTHAAFEPQ